MGVYDVTPCTLRNIQEDSGGCVNILKGDIIGHFD
jgi:hypothetical protein